MMKTPKISARLFRALGLIVIIVIALHSLINQWMAHVLFLKVYLVEETWESLTVSLIFALMTIPLFLFVIYQLANSIFGIRLDRLLNGFENLAKGNLAYRVALDGRSSRKNDRYFSKRDELDIIIESFDEMAARLENIDNRRNQQEEKLSFLATHDQLTELPNRLMLEQAMKRAIARAKRNKRYVFLLLMDVDNFKLVNDALGHAAGDQVLRTISQMLQTMMRGSDLLTRMGGDEFMLLLEDIDSIAEARSVAERMCNAINEHNFLFETHNFHLSLSIGIVAMDGVKEVREVLAQADTALFNAKRWGRNRVVVYGVGGESKNRLAETSLWVTRILEAIKEDRFCLYFQPVVHLEKNQIDHYEALLRLKNGDGTTVLPGVFLPIAEQFGLMPRIDRWVVKETITTLHKKSKLNLFMNLSSFSLSDESILEFVEMEISRSGIAPGRLGFEITETAVVQDLELAESWIRRLKALGCRFALDDFGAGFSSFLYLRNLPLDQIKLDGFFIRTLGREASQRNVVQAMHELANALQIETVAEYVEDQEIVTVLKEIGVRFGQGNFLGLPDPEFQRKSQLLDSVV
jgi:diguanylate cyclase (GGDEF)-like protein